MKKTIAAFISILLITAAGASALADEPNPEAARTLLKNSIQEVLEVLKDEDLTEEAQKGKIESIIDPVFNYDLIARLSLGRTHWGKLDTEQREIFVDRFVTRLKDSYFENIAIIEGDEETSVDFGAAETDNNRVHIPVKAGMGDASVDMRYKFHYSDDEGWRVYDVEISGVSIVSSYRSQFNQVLATSSVDEMLEKLKTLEAPAVE